MTIFDYSDELENVNQIIAGGNPAFNNGDWIDTPNDSVFFQSLFNPGHDGTTLFLEYFLEVTWYSQTASQTLSYKWQYRESGGSWTDLVSNTVTSGSGSPYQKQQSDWGIFTTQITLPIEIRVIGTDADANWQIYVGSTYGDLFMRAVGEVS